MTRNRLWIRMELVKQLLNRLMITAGYKTKINLIDDKDPKIIASDPGYVSIVLPVSDTMMYNAMDIQKGSSTSALFNWDHAITGISAHEVAHHISREPAIVYWDIKTPSKKTILSSEEFVKIPKEERITLVKSLMEKRKNGEIRKLSNKVINLVNDSNDFTVVPSVWPWTCKYTQYFIDFICWRIGILPERKSMTKKPVEMEDMDDREIEFARLEIAMLQYLRTLRINYNGVDITNLPPKDTIYKYFTEIREALRDLRISYNKKTINDLKIENATIIEDQAIKCWIDNGGTIEEFPWYLEEDTRLEIEPERVIEDPKRTMPKGVGPEGIEGIINSGGDRSADSDKSESIGEDETKGTHEPGTGSKIESSEIMDHVLDKYRKEGSVFEADPQLSLDLAKAIFTKLSQNLEEKRMTATAEKGRKISTRRMIDVFTDRANPRIWKDNRIPEEKRLDAHLVCVFDRSGSMSGEPGNKSRVFACSMLFGLSFYENIELSYIQFGSPANIIFDKKPKDIGTKIGEVFSILDPRGENDVPDGLYKALEILKDSTAKRRVIFITNDGDLATGQDRYNELYCSKKCKDGKYNSKKMCEKC